MIDSRKSILKPNLKVGDALVDTSSHTIFKVTRVKLNRGWKRCLWLFLLVGEHSRYHKL
jgi:hypothetical protein